MSLIVDAAKSLRRASANSRLGEMHREWVFSRAMSRYLDDPIGSLEDPDALFGRLVYGWGNASWSALTEYLEACVRHADEARRGILECGSGLSTLLVGAVAQRNNVPYFALEHSKQWTEQMQRALKQFGLDQVQLHEAQLHDYGEYEWYSTPAALSGKEFDLVICDGPPGVTKGGRYGLVPVMQPQLADGCLILLDDAHRDEEKTIARRWQSALCASVEVRGTQNPYIELVLGTNAGAAAATRG